VEKLAGRVVIARGARGARLCPARRGISRSASVPQAVLSVSGAVIPAKLLRLVCDTAAVRAGGQKRSAAGSDPDRSATFVRATILKSPEPARAGESAVAAGASRRSP